jgi:hypothetical protein
MNSASAAVPTITSDCRIVLWVSAVFALFALAVFVVIGADGQRVAHASVGPVASNACTAERDDPALVQPSDDAPSDCELTAGEPEDVDKDAWIEATAVQLGSDLAPLAPFSSSPEQIAHAPFIAQPLVRDALPRGPP